MSLNNLANIFNYLGRYADAEPLYKRSLGIREKALGPNHLDVAASLNDLANLYAHQSRYADAEPMYKRSLAIRKKALGADDVAVAKSLFNLGNLYYVQDRYVDADPLYKRSLAIRDLDADDVNVAKPLNKLANLYYVQHRYADAEPLYKRLLAIQEKVLGLNHLDVAVTLNNLANLYNDQDRYAYAEPLYKRSLAIREMALSPDDPSVAPSVAQSLSNLATVYLNQGRNAEAEPLYKRSLMIREMALGPDHPDVAQSLSHLANIYYVQDRYADAEPLSKRSLAIREKALGPDHPDVAEALNNLAELYIAQDHYADAEPLFKRSLAIREKAFGPDHPDVAEALNSLAVLYTNQSRYADAEPMYKRSLAIWKKALGADAVAVAKSLNNLANLYYVQERYADAEPLFKRSLAIKEKALGPNHPDVSVSLNNLAALYAGQGLDADALPFSVRTMSNNTAETWVALAVLFGAQASKLISGKQAFEDSLDLVQRAVHTAISEALNKLAARFAAGTDRLAQLVRTEQDLAAEARRLDKTMLEALSKDPSKRDAAAERRIRDRVSAVVRERDELQGITAAEFPDYAALSQPQPLTVKDVRSLLADDEALLVLDLGLKSFVWAITQDQVDWRELAVTAAQVSKTIEDLRSGLDVESSKPFDAELSFELYRQLLLPLDEVIASKPRLSVVVNGALTGLPLQVLVTRDPTDKALKDVDWLIRRHAITVLPSVASLKVLRGPTRASAGKPLIGFADPVFDRTQQPQLQRIAINVAVTKAIRRGVADVLNLVTALDPLPQTADELRRVGASVGATGTDLILGLEATETRVKQTKLDDYRIVYFATHGLLADEVGRLAKLNTEPALVLSLPENPTEFNDGLLTASEVAQLKLNANWVVLSACNTASGNGPGAEPLSGLASAFFYAGARSILVSHWGAEVDSSVELMAGTFAALAVDSRLSHGEALQKAMLAMIENPEHPEWAAPKFWAPFIVVGEPAKPRD